MDVNGVIKVADFGLSEDIYTSTYYRHRKTDTTVKLPMRWMAPESITDGIFTEKSDIVSANAAGGLSLMNCMSACVCVHVVGGQRKPFDPQSNAGSSRN